MASGLQTGTLGGASLSAVVPPETRITPLRIKATPFPSSALGRGAGD